jgi:hypothetical protein
MKYFPSRSILSKIAEEIVGMRNRSSPRLKKLMEKVIRNRISKLILTLTFLISRCKRDKTQF